MNIGIVGLGVVGSAIRHGFTKLGHDVKVHDINIDTELHAIGDTEIVFVCVPTPQLESGRADTEIVKEVVRDIVDKTEYTGIVAIKSTVEPGTTEGLINEYPEHDICFVPEFLRARCSIVDFVENHELCIIGTHDERIYDVVAGAHGHYPGHFFRLSPTEAEIAKYFCNTYNAMLITFANVFYEICKKAGADYTAIKAAVTKRDVIGDHYLDCNDNLRGFGGACLPKDTHAIAALAEHMNLDFDLLRAIVSDNDKFPSTTV